MSITLSLNFKHNSTLEFIQIDNYSGYIPRVGETLFFDGAEALELEKIGFPTISWFVTLISNDFADKKITRITLVLVNKSQLETGGLKITKE